jgi:hypothetical protein
MNCPVMCYAPKLYEHEQSLPYDDAGIIYLFSTGFCLLLSTYSHDVLLLICEGDEASLWERLVHSKSMIRPLHNARLFGR